MVTPVPIPIKIFCPCGQNYVFDVYPHNNRMPVPVACPACNRDGTDEANRRLSHIFNGKTQPLPPPAVNQVLNVVQASLAPHLVEALKSAVVGELAAQRRELLSAQQAASAELTELVRRLESVQTPLLERLHAYERRVVELERELATQSKENLQLLELKIEMTRRQLELDRSRVHFN
jgi:exonuclease VII small subunit